MDDIGITFINKSGEAFHTFLDFKLQWISLEIGNPEAITSYMQIPGSSNFVDLMKAVQVDDEPILGRRKMVATFDCIGSLEEWSTKNSVLLNAMNGQEVKMILDTDPQFYYLGVALIETSRENYVDCDYTITLDADPYKYDILRSDDDWLWDPFNFQTGVILTASNIAITSTNKKIVVPKSGVGVIPVIVVHQVTSAMTVTHNGKTYVLKAGRNRFPQIRVGNKEVTLTFTGSGTISIEYRRRLQ